jgi:small GTP-binding protein
VEPHLLIVLTKLDKWKLLSEEKRKDAENVLDVIYEQLCPLGSRRSFISCETGENLENFCMELANLIGKYNNAQEIPADKVWDAVVVGRIGVGKSTFVHCLGTGTAISDTVPTIGTDCSFLNITDDKTGKRVGRLNLWDTAGMERHNSLAKSYFARADIVFIVEEASRIYQDGIGDNIVQWSNMAEEHCPGKPLIFTIFMKADMVDTAQQNIISNGLGSPPLVTTNSMFFSRKDPTKIHNFGVELLKKICC